MAKALTLALPVPLPLPQSQKLNQILLHTHFNRNTISSSCTRIFSSYSHNNTNRINTPNNVNFVHNRRFTSISVTPFSPLSYSNLPFCSSCNHLCFPSSSLLSLLRSRLSSLWIVNMSHNDELGSTHPHNSTKTMKCIIKGRVQGVFYRNWTIDNATELGLKGWVRNRRDGSVEALFSGNARAVDEMLQRCRRGPPHAMVTALDSSPSDEDPGTGFERKPTV